MMNSPTTTIRAATPADTSAIADLLAEAFLNGDFAPWLIAHLDTRAGIYPRYFRLLTDQALDHGQVEIATDHTTDRPAAVAVWYPISGGPPPAALDYDTRLAAITGPNAARFNALDEAMHRNHPYGQWHHYLALLGVDPDRQGQGWGSALLAHHHAELDAAGTPAYLEATGGRTTRLYFRHGYRPRAPYLIAGDGPRLFPMWRQPAETGGPATAGEAAG